MATRSLDTHVRLLDVDPGLGAGLAPPALELAREVLVAPVVALDKGPWRPALPERPDQHLGVLVLEGVLIRSITLADRESAELLGPGDLLRPWQRPRSAELATRAGWTVVEPATLAVLDARVTGTVGRWPELVAATVGRAVERSRALALALGIAQITGVELRLLAMLWHLADRFGHRDADRSVIPIRLTHQMLAALVRTQRQTASSALRRLAEQGLIARGDDGTWALLGEPPPDLGTLRRAIAA